MISAISSSRKSISRRQALAIVCHRLLVLGQTLDLRGEPLAALQAEQVGHRRAGSQVALQVASRADSGEVLHIRLRKGRASSSRAVVRFAAQLIARVARAGAGSEKLLRADSAFWNRKLIARLQTAGLTYSIGVRLQFWVPDAIAAIPESAWRPLDDYPEDGEAQIAETTAGGG